MASTKFNASGAVISNGHVTWATSDPKVALVSPAGLVTAVDGGQVKITATSGSATASVDIAVAVGALVTTSGASISVLNSRVSLLVPAQSLSQSATITFAPAPTVPADARMMDGTAVTITR